MKILTSFRPPWKPPLSAASLVALWFLILSANAADPQRTAGAEIVMPVSPELLLSSLPKVPEDWILKTSTAETDLAALAFLTTVARRSYQIPNPPEQEEKEIHPRELSLEVIDLGSDVESCKYLSQSTTIAEDAPPAAKERTFTPGPGMQGVISKRSNGNFVFEAILGNRVSVRIVSRGMAEMAEFRNILRLMDFQTLVKLSSKIPSQKHSGMSFPQKSVDELNPERNRSSITQLAERPTYNPDDPNLKDLVPFEDPFPIAQEKKPPTE